MICNQCGNSDRYYRKTYVYGHSITYYDGDTHYYSADNGQLHDDLNYNDYKTCYCAICDKKLSKKELERKEEC